MKKIAAIPLIFVLFLFSSCTAIGDIFKTGVGVGIFVVVVIIVIIFLIRGSSKKS